MSVLLPTDQLEVCLPGEPDEHGWVQADEQQMLVWAGRGSVQLAAGISNVDASVGGGHGPHGPASTELGTVFLPAEVPAVDGMVLAARGVRYVLGSVRFVPDPAGAGLDCVVASLTELDDDVEPVVG